jgi:hypothetical protein
MKPFDSAAHAAKFILSEVEGLRTGSAESGIEVL